MRDISNIYDDDNEDECWKVLCVEQNRRIKELETALAKSQEHVSSLQEKLEELQARDEGYQNNLKRFQTTVNQALHSKKEQLALRRKQLEQQRKKEQQLQQLPSRPQRPTFEQEQLSPPSSSFRRHSQHQQCTAENSNKAKTFSRSRGDETRTESLTLDHERVESPVSDASGGCRRDPWGYRRDLHGRDAAPSPTHQPQSPPRYHTTLKTMTSLPRSENSPTNNVKSSNSRYRIYTNSTAFPKRNIRIAETKEAMSSVSYKQRQPSQQPPVFGDSGNRNAKNHQSSKRQDTSSLLTAAISDNVLHPVEAGQAVFADLSNATASLTTKRYTGNKMNQQFASSSLPLRKDGLSTSARHTRLPTCLQPQRKEPSSPEIFSRRQPKKEDLKHKKERKQWRRTSKESDENAPIKNQSNRYRSLRRLMINGNNGGS